MNMPAGACADLTGDNYIAGWKTRGDWQIAAWLFPRVPSATGKANNPISLLSKWKIFDNLRRSLNFFFLTIFFVAGIFWLPGANWIWVLAAFGIIAFPTYITLFYYK